jgi:RNA polymerase-binding transcription factor DksA
VLREKRAQLVEDYERCLASLRDPVNVDFDNGDVAELEYRAEAALIVDYLSREIHAVDDALARLARSEYGVCVSCRHRIPRGRLLAQPTARRCFRCQASAERKVG